MSGLRARPAAIPIDDPADPRVAPYVAIRERDLVGRRGEFIAEGAVVLRVLLGAGARCRPSSLLVAETRLDGLADLTERIPPDVPVYAARPAVMDAITGFHIHRGVLAHGARPPDLGPEALLAGLRREAIVMALFGVSNHDNMGGLFRNAAAFGVEAVLLDPSCCDPLYRKAIRVSVGAALKTPFARLADDEDALALLEAHAFAPLALAPHGATRLSALEPALRAAILLGSEGAGLPPDILGRARTVSIPMAAGWDALNVAAASAIALHCLTEGRERARR
jgi:tRNA G18 (ribose-2'-O)-methylase SpoU